MADCTNGCTHWSIDWFAFLGGTRDTGGIGDTTMRKGLCVLMLGLALGGCASEEMTYRQSILSANETMEARFREGDVHGVAAMYTDDAVMQGPSEQRVVGREGVSAYWEGFAEPVGLFVVEER